MLELQAVVRNLIDNNELTGLNVAGMFRHSDSSSAAIARNLSAGFLIVLSGNSHPSYDEARAYMNKLESDDLWSDAVRFFKQGISLILDEVSNLCNHDKEALEKLTSLSAWFSSPEVMDNSLSADKVREFFSPESAGLLDNVEEKTASLREKRLIKITELNSSPIQDPAEEVLFTSNILITVPPPSKTIDNLGLSKLLKKELDKIVREDQVFWYDHPVPMGITPVQNEVLYGLAGLDRAVEFEQERGAIKKDSKVACVLSVSVTHKGLQNVVKRYLEEELRKEQNIRNLDVYVFTEADTNKLVRDILIPLAKYTGSTDKARMLYDVFGVDGEYGRHYSFLKAIAAFWQVFINPVIKGTFKIDLDQVFPQKELVEQGGASAFDHLRTPLWGAEGTDSSGNSVELGMIAGALVNEKDFDKGIFTPDVTVPANDSRADELFFFSTLPQALSTEAEMMTRYNSDDLDGKKHCIQRIHVTGGTNGILIESLRKHRPFTPTFIGRAEDQAYILSVLFDGSKGKLRYVHKDGLIMRHDKEAFAVEAIKMAAAGKLIGDYVRILMFSYYAKALPWKLEDIKNEIDPFTGCFVSRIPVTIVYLRFALKLASMFSDSSGQNEEMTMEFFKVGTRRLDKTIQTLIVEPNPLIEQFKKEKQAWNLFYDILDRAEEKIETGNAIAAELKNKAASLIENCKIRFK